jgi:DNA-binding transcriptional regulator YiaG
MKRRKKDAVSVEKYFIVLKNIRKKTGQSINKFAKHLHSSHKKLSKKLRRRSCKVESF